MQSLPDTGVGVLQIYVKRCARAGRGPQQLRHLRHRSHWQRPDRARQAGDPFGTTEEFPTRTFDLITCLHGLHYVGDKLAVLTRTAGWLTPAGRLVADLGLSSIRLPDGRPAGQRLTARLRAAGFSYDSRRRRISCTGRRDARLPYSYLGADQPEEDGLPVRDEARRRPGGLRCQHVCR